ncbi:MAG: putative Ig domain-containing protein [candidate division KSB1 bacterium]|nr:putative Ig domain-containing protein [candidate division KSB1 bacterium]MDZ7300887.1 putative Ig domain-containing protein [candidate division KSB1 bacterium]MDZ7309843.1 putative Ig domain-containing protein [candidate division KSB1 bacterium]
MQLRTATRTIHLSALFVAQKLQRSNCALGRTISRQVFLATLRPVSKFAIIGAVVFLFPMSLASQTNYNLPLVVASGEQLAPLLMSDNMEGAFVVWQDKRAGRSAIYAQHVNNLSQPVWKQDGLAIAASSKDQLAPVAIDDGKGGVLIFWQDLRNDEGDIYGQHLDGTGSLLWGNTGIPIIRANGRQAEPKAVGDGQNGAFILWREFKSGNEDIFVQRIDGNGTILLETAGKAVAQGAGNQILGDVAVAPNGDLVVAWSDNSSGLALVTAQRFDAMIKPRWSAGLLVTAVKSTQTAPVLHVDRLGNTFIVWTDSRNRNLDLYAQKVDAAGQLLWGQSALPVCKATNDQYSQQIASDGSDGILIVWEDKRSGKPDIYGQALNAAGQARWQNDGVGISTSSQEQTQPRVAADGSGGLICAWTDDRGTGTNIGVQRLNKDGKALWAANGILITNDEGTKQRPAILAQSGSFLGAGGSFVVWDDTRRGNVDIFAQPLKGDGTFANVPPRILSSPVTEAREGRLYSYQVQAIDYDSADPLRLELLTPQNKTWLQIDNAKLQLFGTPGAGDAGEVAVTLVVKDKLGASASQSFTLKVIGSNHPPQITSKPDTVAIEDQLYFYKIVAIDPDSGDALTFTIETAAQWLQLSNDGKVSGTPANEHVGSYTVTVRVTDTKGATATQSFTLRVKNVNDPPFFTSQPDTFAFVDSLYVYRVSAADVDRDDTVQIVKRVAPDWLSWNANTQTLQGRPASSHWGTIYAVNFLARDAAGATAEQSFRLHVMALGAPDTVAPAAPLALRIQPAQWSANRKFTLQWQNPADPSGIAGVFYKIGAAPTHHRDGVFVSGAIGAKLDQLELLAPQEGKLPVYLWLMDGRGNVDFRTAARAICHYDATPPLAQKNLSPDRRWTRGDSVRLQWTPATDTISGIRSYHFYFEGKLFGFIPGDSSSFMLILQLAEKTYSWALMAEDSAGNLGAWTSATFSVDRHPPTLLHTATDTATTSMDVTLSAQATDAASGIRAVRLYHRAAGERAFRSKNLPAVNGGTTFTARLEAAEVVPRGLEYYLEAADSAGNLTHWPVGAPGNFHAVVVASANLTAPAPLVAGHYQIFSVPYYLLNASPESLLEDDLGSYDPSVWRLFRYQPGEGNVEFGKPNLEKFTPGRAFWLITTRPQNYDTGPVHSVRTDTPFALTLQPGWNLIATPFDFPTAWSAVQRPEGVENNLWAFEGTRYLGQQEVLLPWQGYFLRNLEMQPRTITIAPVAGTQVTKSTSPVTEIFWQVQLRVTDGEFCDDANYLGSAATADEAWDPLDLSEPPVIGDYVSLYFDRHNWPRYAGLFTSDFRPDVNIVQKWPFTVVASRPGLPVKLTWEYSGDVPRDWIFVLEDLDGRLRRRIEPEQMLIGDDAGYVFRATSQPRDFIWWAGREEQLAEAGALHNLIPAAFELLPSYPNPLVHLGRNQPAVIRFGLPITTPVQARIFDLAGRPVRTFEVGENLPPGYHEVHWDGRDGDGHPVAAGIYIFRLEASEYRASRKLILLR